MRILAFDTATPATTVALSGVGDVVYTARDDPRRGERPGHATRLLPLTAAVMERAGTGWDGVDRIAVGLGPGTFTGLRIGIATARALARARDVPLVGVSTLQSLALARSVDGVPSGLDVVFAVIDARRGEVFAASWRIDEAQEFDNALLLPRAFAPEVLAELIAPLGETALAIGDGAIAFRKVLERSGAFIPDDDSQLHRVTATNHCRLAASLQASVPDEVRPDYLRAPDAEMAHRS
ncbi:MAG: tRNA (adenosine(37)-N6)-threonylcarbamoyltransferase complex dimerization subunit type 1 TsaB [Solirubrobacterales bacterium]|nr:tRNA (adenosine(37)-N6)-threonylcarbamoyltransferase complex dimerization subunit type 1 TsaB [Solirubrobacterales bacterium]